ncbi:hypothetical protein NEAUS03_1926, partial [Nematocida ausubeli]
MNIHLRNTIKILAVCACLYSVAAEVNVINPQIVNQAPGGMCQGIPGSDSKGLSGSSGLGQ